MKFGILQMTHCLPDESAAVVYERFVDTAVEAERLGYWSCWTTEHHFGSDPAYRPFDASEAEYRMSDYDLAVDPLTLFTYVGAKTTRLRLGTGVVVLHWDHPVRVAERAAMLDVLTGGRLELGVGRGAGFREVGMFDVPQDNDESRRKFEESIDIIQTAWRGEHFDYDGEFYQLENLKMVPVPTRQPAPIWVASASMDSAAYAGRMGLPYATITWPLTPLEIYVQKRAVYLQAAEEAGQDVSDLAIPHVLFMHCADTDAEAQDLMYKHLIQFQYVVEQHYENLRPGKETLPAGFFGDLDALARFPVEHHIVGSPDTCIERLEWFKREVGLNYLVGFVDAGRVPRDKVHKSLQLFSEKVMPHFAGELVGESA